MHSRFMIRLFNSQPGFSLGELPPIFLAPSLQSFSPQCSKFSTSSRLSKDLNKQRGVSAIHRTGPRHPLSISKFPLPRPAAPQKQDKRETNPNHGLWGFFPENRQAIPTPEDEYAFGKQLLKQDKLRSYNLLIVDHRSPVDNPRTSGEVVG